jgi:hypothetical protein
MHDWSPLRLSPEDKLDVLRYLDDVRSWRSVDDERFCTQCHQTITGRKVLVFERQGTRGDMRLQCPTIGCVSTPIEWVYADPDLPSSRHQSQPTSKSDFLRSSSHIGTLKPKDNVVTFHGK